MKNLNFPKYFLLLTFTLFLNASIANAVTVTFSYTGSQQTWTVPNGVTSITVDAHGAGGGDSGGKSGGNGARVQTTLTVTPGNVLYISRSRQFFLSELLLSFIIEMISSVRSPLSIGLGLNPIFSLSFISSR